MTPVVRILLALLLALPILATPPLPGGAGTPVATAWADDDGGDDDDDDDDGGSDDDDDDGHDGGSSSGSDSGSRDDGIDGSDDGDDVRPTADPGSVDDLLAPLRSFFGSSPPAPAPQPVVPPPPPTAAAGEIVTLDLSEDDLSALVASGFQVLDERAVANLDLTARRLRIPDGLTLAEARAALRSLPSGRRADFNHYYRPEQAPPVACQGLECPARLMIDWPPAGTRQDSCVRDVPIGMVDTGINDAHETFRGARLELHRLGGVALEPASAIHGTAVAALLVGDPAGRSPGLVPAAPLVAVDAFHRAGTDERADVYSLVEALGLLVDRGVRVINLSLSGPPNTVLEEIVTRIATDRDIVLVAAAGNAGPSAPPAYPAAYDPVIAVTAVDRNRQVYRRAGRGSHIDLAAPGVDVWTAASIRGARWKTGTSFAAPFVAAAAAMLRQQTPDMSADAVRQALLGRTIDLGDPGPDAVYGAGLLSVEGLCDGGSGA